MADEGDWSCFVSKAMHAIHPECSMYILEIKCLAQAPSKQRHVFLNYTNGKAKTKWQIFLDYFHLALSMSLVN